MSTNGGYKTCKKKLKTLPEKYDLKMLLNQIKKTIEKIKQEIGKDINLEKPTWEEALNLSKKYDILPLHPNYNLFWHDLKIENIIKLAKYIKENAIFSEEKTNNSKK